MFVIFYATVSDHKVILKVALMCNGTHKHTNLRLSAFNVEKLKSKLEDPCFIKLVQQFDISVLTETWKRDTPKLELEGFCNFSQLRQEHFNAIRHFGGITALVKNTKRQGVRLAEYSEGLNGFCLKNHFLSSKMMFPYVEPIYLPAIQLRTSIQKQTVLGI